MVIAPPAFDELQQMCKLRGEKCQKTEAELRSTCEQHATLMKSEYAKYFDLVLVNRNHDITFRLVFSIIIIKLNWIKFRRLLDTLEHLRTEPQWIPVEWLK